jgi:hypothetical protein
LPYQLLQTEEPVCPVAQLAAELARFHVHLPLPQEVALIVELELIPDERGVQLSESQPEVELPQPTCKLIVVGVAVAIEVE